MPETMKRICKVGLCVSFATFAVTASFADTEVVDGITMDIYRVRRRGIAWWRFVELHSRAGGNIRCIDNSINSWRQACDEYRELRVLPMQRADERDDT